MYVLYIVQCIIQCTTGRYELCSNNDNTNSKQIIFLYQSLLLDCRMKKKINVHLVFHSTVAGSIYFNFSI